MKNYVNITYKDKLPNPKYAKDLAVYLIRKANINSFLSNCTGLDLGCGRGEYLDAFSTYIDIEGFDRCTLEKKGFKIKQGDLNKTLPYEDNTFDFVFSKSVIEHVYYPENIFAEVYRILKKEGKFIVMTPDWESCWRKFYYDFTHRTPFTLASLKNIFELYSFKNIKCNKMRQLPCTWYNGKEYYYQSRQYGEFMNLICDIVQLLYTPKTKNKFIQFSKEKMLLGIGEK